MEIRASSYHLKTTDAEEEQVDVLFEDGGISQHRGETLAIAIEDGEVVGALTEYNGDEWSVAVDSGCQGVGVATRLVQAVIAQGGSGFMVAGTDDGVSWLHGLYWKLTEDERESLEVPSWEGIEENV